MAVLHSPPLLFGFQAICSFSAVYSPFDLALCEEGTRVGYVLDKKTNKKKYFSPVHLVCCPAICVGCPD